MPTDITETDFKEFLDLNKICYAKAERLKSKKGGRVLPIFQLELSDPAEAEALLSQNLMCNVTGIVYKVEEFRQPVSVRQCFNCQCFGHSAQNCKSKQKCVICGENHSHKGCPEKKKQNSPSVPTVQGHVLHLIRGVPNIKSRHSGNMWSTTKNLCRRSKPKISPTAQNSNFPIYCRTAHQICSQCGHPNSPATGVVPKSQTGHA